MKKNLFKKILGLTAVIGVGILTLGISSCGKSNTVKIGVCGASNDHWKAVQYVLDQENSGIKLELVEFSAYTLPNQALNSGDIDLNAFQHKAYLNKDANDNNYELSVIGDTLIAPLTIYSKKYNSVDEIKAAAGAGTGRKSIRYPGRSKRHRIR